MGQMHCGICKLCLWPESYANIISHHAWMLCLVSITCFSIALHPYLSAGQANYQDVHEQPGPTHIPLTKPSCDPSHWVFFKANWEQFHDVCLESISEDILEEADPLHSFVEHITKAANDCIPRATTIPKKSNPWFDEECRESLKARRALDKRVRQSREWRGETISAFRRSQAKARWLFNQNKRQSWAEYVSKLSAETPLKHVWDRVRKISGKNICPSKQYLNGKNGTTITDPKDIAENFELPCTDVFIKIQPFISSLWQERWDKEVGNKLHAIMPQIDDKYYSGCTNRKDEVIINRLRIGHTRLTHSFRMENRPHPPLCDQCEGDHELTVKHILIECNFLKIIRRRHYDVTDLNQLFKTVSSKRILDFVKDIGLYNSL